MILANVAAAETLEKGARAADLSRARRASFRLKSSTPCGNSWQRSRFQRSRQRRHPQASQAFNRILARVKGQDAEQLVNEVVLRSQAQAEYAAENYVHFGLNLRRYAHFTSPIRRYADLIVHRWLISALKLGDDGLASTAPIRKGACRNRRADFHVTERRMLCWPNARPADRLIAHFLSDYGSGATFEGRISTPASRAPACSSN